MTLKRDDMERDPSGRGAYCSDESKLVVCDL